MWNGCKKQKLHNQSYLILNFWSKKIIWNILQQTFFISRWNCILGHSHGGSGGHGHGHSHGGDPENVDHHEGEESNALMDRSAGSNTATEVAIRNGTVKLDLDNPKVGRCRKGNKQLIRCLNEVVFTSLYMS